MSNQARGSRVWSSWRSFRQGWCAPADSRRARQRSFEQLRPEALEPRLLLSVNDGNLAAVLPETGGVSDQAQLPTTTETDSLSGPLALTSTTHIVRAGDSLQAALDLAQAGDIIELEAGATFVGQFVLPNKAGSDWITIRSSALDQLPAGRVSAAHAHLMPRIMTDTVHAPLRMELGSHHWRLEGVEVTSSASLSWALFRIGYDGRYPETTAEFAHDVVIDRSYFHGLGDNQITHAIDAAGGNISLTNSEVSNIKRKGFDAQAFISPLGLSGFNIENNFLEATGENIMFGGLGRDIPDEFNPREILIRGNSISKPNAWKLGHEEFAGTEYTIKNLIEFKVGKHIVVENNVLDNNWQAAQAGFAFLMTPREADLDDIVVRDNIIRNVRSFAVINPHDHEISNIVFQNNLAYNLEHHLWVVSTPDGKVIDNLTIENNTALFGDTAVQDGAGTSNLTLGENDTAVRNLIYRDNVISGGLYDIKGNGVRAGLESVLSFVDGFDVRGNQVLISDADLSKIETYRTGSPYEEGGDYYGQFSLWLTPDQLGFANPELSLPEHFDLSGSPFVAGKGANIGQLLTAVNLPPAAVGVAANSLTERSVSQTTAAVTGLTTLDVTFNRPVFFSAADVTVQRVTFPGGVEVIGDAVPIQSVQGSGSSSMRIEFAPGEIVNTWVKVTLHDSIVDADGVALDGESPATSRQLGFIYDSAADFPTGNHIAGGDLVFYSGNLVGDVDGDATVGSSDAQTVFRNVTGVNPDPPALPFARTELEGDLDGDGDIDNSDIGHLFTSYYNTLDPLTESLVQALSLSSLSDLEEATDADTDATDSIYFTLDDEEEDPLDLSLGF